MNSSARPALPTTVDCATPLTTRPDSTYKSGKVVQITGTTSIFTFTGREGKAGDEIELTKGGRQFLIDNEKVVDSMAVSGWVRFSEAFTSAPRLHDKIGGMNVARGAVSQWRNPLNSMQNGKCFYDEGHEMTSPEVDHVLPWSFVLENRTWNLVLACRNCNNEKRDRLASSTDCVRFTPAISATSTAPVAMIESDIGSSDLWCCMHNA